MSTQSRHILGVFEESIRHLNSEILRMGQQAQSNLEHAIRGLLERISDHAVSLARRARQIIANPALPESEELRPLGDLAAAMLKDAVSSFCDGNLEAALMIQGRDGDLDAAYRAFNKMIVARIPADAARAQDYVDLLFCARFIERIGDQSVNVSEDAVYLLTARDIRHGGERPELK